MTYYWYDGIGDGKPCSGVIKLLEESQNKFEHFLRIYTKHFEKWELINVDIIKI